MTELPAKTISPNGANIRSYKVTHVAGESWEIRRSNNKIGSIRRVPDGFHAVVGGMGGKWVTKAETMERGFDRCVDLVELGEAWKAFDFEPDFATIFAKPRLRWELKYMRYAGLDADIALEQAKRDHARKVEKLTQAKAELMRHFQPA